MPDKWIDGCIDFVMRWIFAPVFFLLLASVVIGGAWYGITELTRKEEKTVAIRPFYWSCTSAYVSHQKGYTGNIKTGGTRYYDYYECKCNQWTAHMVDEAAPKDATCSGDIPAELKGVRP